MEMVLDMDLPSLRFKINGLDKGVAFNGHQLKQGPYFLTVLMRASDSACAVTILKSVHANTLDHQGLLPREVNEGRQDNRGNHRDSKASNEEAKTNELKYAAMEKELALVKNQLMKSENEIVDN